MKVRIPAVLLNLGPAVLQDLEQFPVPGGGGAGRGVGGGAITLCVS